MELFQAEWCPHSHNVRQRLTELEIDFMARQVPADPDERPDADEHKAKSEEKVESFEGWSPCGRRVTLSSRLRA